MAKKNERVNTEKLFQVMTGENKLTQQEAESEEAPAAAKKEKESVSEKAPAVKEKKTKTQKKIQIAPYITEDLEKELRMQVALREKENDKSALVRAGLEIVLSMSKDTYAAMIAEAAAKDMTTGELVEKALKAYLNQ